MPASVEKCALDLAQRSAWWNTVTDLDLRVLQMWELVCRSSSGPIFSKYMYSARWLWFTLQQVTKNVSTLFFFFFFFFFFFKFFVSVSLWLTLLPAGATCPAPTHCSQHYHRHRKKQKKLALSIPTTPVYQRDNSWPTVPRTIFNSSSPQKCTMSSKRRPSPMPSISASASAFGSAW
jgi:hypothetical protein